MRRISFTKKHRGEARIGLWFQTRVDDQTFDLCGAGDCNA
jgi:hypothetical protein